MALTITEHIVRNREKMRRCLLAQKERKTIKQIAAEEGSGRLAKQLAAHLSQHVHDAPPGEELPQASNTDAHADSNNSLQTAMPAAPSQQDQVQPAAPPPLTETAEEQNHTNEPDLHDTDTDTAAIAPLHPAESSSKQEVPPAWGTSLCSEVQLLRILIERFVNDFSSFSSAFLTTGGLPASAPLPAQQTEASPREEEHVEEKKIPIGDIPGLIDHLQGMYQ